VNRLHERLFSPNFRFQRKDDPDVVFTLAPRSRAREYKARQQAKAWLYKRGQRTPLESTNNVVLHTDQEQCCLEAVAVWFVNNASRRIAKDSTVRQLGRMWWV
jgi:hypothetical protein